MSCLTYMTNIESVLDKHKAQMQRDANNDMLTMTIISTSYGFGGLKGHSFGAKGCISIN